MHLAEELGQIGENARRKLWQAACRWLASLRTYNHFGHLRNEESDTHGNRTDPVAYIVQRAEGTGI